MMAEHRLIERMIEILNTELKAIQANKEVDPVFIDNVVDFVRTYADQTHHGKEEDILFRELKKKDLKPEHEATMNELIQEHIFGRKTTGELVEENRKYAQGDKGALNTIIEKIETLVGFYPKHIEKEDKHFFIPVMKYFSKEEQDAMLEEGQIYDRRMIHRKYDALVNDYEKVRDITSRTQKEDWIKYM